MASMFRSALDIVMEWGIPATLTGLGAWIAVKRDAIRARWKRRQARRTALDDFIEQQMPELVRFVSTSNERADKAQARETRITTELQGFREHLSRQDGVLAEIVSRQEDVQAQMWAQARFDNNGRFRCDHTGRNISVNEAFAKMLHVSEFELGDFRWKNCLDDAHSARYLSDVARCFAEHRRYNGQAIFKRPNGTRIRCQVRIEPHPEDAADLGEGKFPTWFGYVMFMEELA